ncbi:MAG: hypothetical protein R2854_28260 [Caldilineaceae bacterium]
MSLGDGVYRLLSGSANGGFTVQSAGADGIQAQPDRFDALYLFTFHRGYGAAPTLYAMHGDAESVRQCYRQVWTASSAMFCSHLRPDVHVMVVRPRTACAHFAVPACPAMQRNIAAHMNRT